jgi:hypothetical protein
MKPYVINIWTLFFFLNIMLPISLQAQSGSEAISYGNNKNAGNFIVVNGIKLYYKIFGEGAPLVLIHGNAGNLCIFTGENHFVTKNNPVLFNSAVAKYFSEPFKGEELRHGD